MAIAGPLSSIVLGVVFYGASRLGRAGQWPRPVDGVLGYLAYLNLTLAAFNLVPAFPLDGGRVLRSILWHSRNDLRWATHLASRIGSGFGALLIVVGVISIISGQFVGGIWWLLIGLFLRSASHSSYQEMLRRRALQGELVRQIMRPDPITVAPELPVSDFVQDYVYRYHYALFPVVRDGMLRGCISTREVREIPREDWSQRRVGDVSSACVPGNTVSPDTDALQVLQTMRRTGNTRLMVIERDRLVGIITLKDLLSFIAARLDLEGKGAS
jgi:CBS domain-containing protein